MINYRPTSEEGRQIMIKKQNTIHRPEEGRLSGTSNWDCFTGASQRRSTSQTFRCLFITTLCFYQTQTATVSSLQNSFDLSYTVSNTKSFEHHNEYKIYIIIIDSFIHCFPFTVMIQSYTPTYSLDLMNRVLFKLHVRYLHSW